MELYLGRPRKLIRVSIKRRGLDSQHLAFSGTSVEDVFDLFYNVIMVNAMNDYKIRQDDEYTTIGIREQIDGVNGKSRSFSFRCIPPMDIKRHVYKHFGVDFSEYVSN